MALLRRVSIGVIIGAALPAYAEGLPQMDQAWFANQLFWLAVTFAALFMVVSVFIVPTVRGILTTRENAIDDAIREAEAAKHEAESTRGHATSASEEARQQAAAVMAKVQAEASSDASDAMAKLDRDLERKAGYAQTLVAEAVQKAESGVEAAAESLAKAMIAKLMTPSEAEEDDAPKLKLAVKR